MDLGDLEHNTRDGLHMASLAGSWLAAVAGFGGMRDHGGELSFRPRLPAAIAELSFRLIYRGTCLRVTITHSAARYELVHGGDPLTIRHDGGDDHGARRRAGRALVERPRSGPEPSSRPAARRARRPR